jgi:hypothetical protein
MSGISQWEKRCLDRAAGRVDAHGSLLNTDVLDDQVLDGNVLSLGVGLGVLEQVQDELDRLDGPSSYVS